MQNIEEIMRRMQSWCATWPEWVLNVLAVGLLASMIIVLALAIFKPVW